MNGDGARFRTFDERVQTRRVLNVCVNGVLLNVFCNHQYNYVKRGSL